MPQLPQTVPSTNVDAPTDQVGLARSDILAAINAINQITGYLTALLGTDGTATTARQTLGLGTAATVSTGTSAGQIPVVQSDGMLPSSVVPTVFAAGEVKTVSWTIGTSDRGKLYHYTGSSSATVTLPSATAAGAGFCVAIYVRVAQSVTLSSSSTIYLPLGSGTWQSGTSLALPAAFGLVLIFATGGAWYVITTQAQVASTVSTQGSSPTATGYRIANGSDLASIFVRTDATGSIVLGVAGTYGDGTYPSSNEMIAIRSGSSIRFYRNTNCATACDCACACGG